MANDTNSTIFRTRSRSNHVKLGNPEAVNHTGLSLEHHVMTRELSDNEMMELCSRYDCEINDDVMLKVYV